MSEVKVNKITPTADCGTVTLGDSGDAITIPSGVTLTSGGAITNSGTITNTGTISGGTISGNIDGQVSWQTTVKTTNFTATAGEGYFVNTTSASITVTLPSSPSAGDLVGIKDYANTADTNKIVIGRNGEKIQGVEANYQISTEGLSIILIYVDSTKGWLSVGQAKASDISEEALFTTATGGTVTTCGDFKIHSFTGPGTFCVSQIGNGPTNPAGGPTAVDYLVVAGGGSGGNYALGGAGAGGFRLGSVSPCATTPLSAPGLTITATSFPITVGGGGSAPPGQNQGSNSVFSTITSTGGGAGGNSPPTQSPDLSAGGSGGAIGRDAYLAGRTSAGNGNSPPVSPPQGNQGGVHQYPSCTSGSRGGGGAGSAGTNGGPPEPGGNAAPVTPIFGASPQPFYTGSPANGSFAGGGGAGTFQGNGGSGGGSSGGTASNLSPGTGGNGQTNTGGGGGSAGPGSTPGGAGGSGIVLIRYKFQ